jgi:hypothetical protein
VFSIYPAKNKIPVNELLIVHWYFILRSCGSICSVVCGGEHGDDSNDDDNGDDIYNQYSRYKRRMQIDLDTLLDQTNQR